MSEIKPCPDRFDALASTCVDLAISKLRNLHEYAGRPAWDQVVASTMKQMLTEYVDDLTASLNRASDACASVQKERDDAVAELKALYRAYVGTLETGRDRIIDLGGDCDSVDRMEEGDPALVRARAFLARYEGGR